MGLKTQSYKRVAWMISAFFLGISGAIFGNMTGFIEPREVAFPTVTFGIFMVLMVLLGGKGTLWGPVVGATVFHVIKEVTWTYLLGWQWVALGVLIVIIVVYLPAGHYGLADGKEARVVRHRCRSQGDQPMQTAAGGCGRSAGGSSPMTTDIIEVDHVSKSYGGVQANNDISIRVEGRRYHRSDRPERIG